MKKFGVRVLKIVSLVLFLIILSSLRHQYLKGKDEASLAKFLGLSLKTCQLDGKTLTYYDKGSGDKTLVFRGGLTTPSAILDFYPLAENLARDYRVIILDPPGYGSTPRTNQPRELSKVNEELYSLLDYLNPQGSVYLINHSLAALYSLDYVNRYEGIAGVINLDGSRPAKEIKTLKSAKSLVSLGLLSEMGFIRNILDIPPLAKRFGYSEEGYSSFYNSDLIKEVSRQYKKNYYSPAIEEYKASLPNVQKDLGDIRYPKDLAVLSLISQETLDNNPQWSLRQAEPFSNPEKQAVIPLDGPHYLHHTATTRILNEIKTFIQNQ